ncbi:MAG: hypothetical protein AAB390_04400 [Patescibacteria group bacterium]
MNFGIFTVDTSVALEFFSQGPWNIITQLIALGGWLILFFLVFVALFHFYVELVEDLAVHKWEYVTLAIDIPALNVQTPKAVEQMFSHIAGALSKPDLKDILLDGYKQRYFSFEIISIEGYIQFLVWTEVAFRDLIEAAVYAQYPDAEIIEVEDYVSGIPDKYPDKDYDVWVSDFGLAENDAYPLRSYSEFEHSISKDTVLKDPMGTFLESFTRLTPGEQMWFQIVVEPIDNSWKEHAIEKIKEVIGEKKSHGTDYTGILVSGLMRFLELLGDEIFNREASPAATHEEKKDAPNQLQYLTPGMKNLVEAMEKKIAKIGLKTKIRGVYAARKEIFNPRRGVNAMLGAINQYNIPSSNSIVPTLTASGSSPKKIKRKNLLIKAYKKRKIGVGGNSFVLNIEELATIWHFPMSHVKTPQVQKSANKQAEPPGGLPVERLMKELPLETPAEAAHNSGRKHYKTDTGEIIEYDDPFQNLP